MKLKKEKAVRILNMLKTQSGLNGVEAQYAIKQYRDGKANENRTIKALMRINEKEIICVERMRNILKSHFPDQEKNGTQNLECVISYIAQFI